MKISSELKAIGILVDGLSRDTDDWENAGCPSWRGDYGERVNATQTGIRDRIVVIRKMLLQIQKDIEKKCK